MVLQLCGRVCRRLFFENPVSNETGFFVFKRFGAVTAFVSPPFFSNPSFLSWGYFFIGTPCSQARFAAFSFAQSGIALESFEKPVQTKRFFCFYALCVHGLQILAIWLKHNTSCIAVGGVAAPEGTITKHTTTRFYLL